MKQAHRSLSPARSPGIAGFSLVEVMVAMVIGMLGLIVMMQVFALFEGQKRTTTGGADAQNTGAIALFGLQRHLQQSGYGTSAFASLGCSLTLPAGPGGPITSGIALNSLAPVTINPRNAANTPLFTGQDANTDTLLLVYSESNSSTEGNQITVQATQNAYSMQNVFSFTTGDYVYAVEANYAAIPQIRPAPCALTLEKILSLTPAGPNPTTVNVTNGVAGMVKGYLYDLGQNIRVLGYAIRGGNLTECDYTVNNCANNNAAFWIPIANNIISMKAEYGREDKAIDTALYGTAAYKGLVNTFDTTTPTTTSATLACDWLRISAIRIALVARSAQFEKTAVTNAAPPWYGSTASTYHTANPIDLSATITPAGSSWQNYRYKVFQTFVPLRNITWMTNQGGTGANGC